MQNSYVDMDEMPLRFGHFRVLFVASLGQLVGAALSTLVSIILPLIQIHLHPQLTSMEQGLVCCTSLVGIMVGSFLFGKLSDQYGYLLFFRLCPCIILVASIFVFFNDTLTGLVVGLFFMGLGAGGEYSLDGDYISEIMPKRWRLFMVGIAKALCSIGNVMTAVICYILLEKDKSALIWNKMVLIIGGIALLMFLLRLFFAQSPGWLVACGRIDEAEKSVRYFLGNDVVMGEISNHPQKKDKPKESWSSLFTHEKLPKVIFSGVPWACAGMGVYGIGIFLPILIMALGLESSALMPLERIIYSVKHTALISAFIFVGFVLGLLLVNRVSHVKLQTWGFILGGVGLILLLIANIFHFPIWISLIGFMIFELFLNAGPNLITYIIPPQIYSVADRGLGAGLAAAFGKVGAILGVVLMPMFLFWGGVKLVLIACTFIFFVGAAVTVIMGHKVLPNSHI